MKLNYHQINSRRCENCRIYTVNTIGKRFYCGICKPKISKKYRFSHISLTDKTKCYYCDSSTTIKCDNVSICKDCGKDINIWLK